ncbi:hypothetical protein Tco_0935687 [Tanacetum coccineum]
MLKKFRLEDSKPTKTSMSTEIKLTKDNEADSVDSTKYQGMIGSLLYLTASMFSVFLCARFQENPKIIHLETVKRIFRYIRGTIHLGLWYPKGAGVETIVYADSDHAGDYVDRKSTSGVCTFMGWCLTSWFAKKQTALAISTTEAEYVSTGKACQQALWMKQALIDYDIRLDDVLDFPLIRIRNKCIRAQEISDVCHQEEIAYTNTVDSPPEATWKNLLGSAERLRMRCGADEDEEQIIARFLGILKPEIGDVVSLQQYYSFNDVCSYTRMRGIMMKMTQRGYVTTFFRTNCTSKGKVCTVIVDGGSCDNMVATTMVEKLGLQLHDHPEPYQLTWLKKGNLLKVKHKCLVQFSIGNKYADEIWCEADFIGLSKLPSITPVFSLVVLEENEPGGDIPSEVLPLLREFSDIFPTDIPHGPSDGTTLKRTYPVEHETLVRTRLLVPKPHGTVRMSIDSRAEVNFLGYLVSGTGIRMDTSKIDAITTWPTPTSLHDVRIECDASGRGIGGVLSQLNRPIAFLAKSSMRRDVDILLTTRNSMPLHEYAVSSLMHTACWSSKQ